MQEQINKIDKVVVGIKKDVEYIKGSQEEQKETMKAFDISSTGTLHYILNTKYQTSV